MARFLPLLLLLLPALVACSADAPPPGESADGAAATTSDPDPDLDPAEAAATGGPVPVAPTPREPHPCVADALAAEPVTGVDVSHHSGDVDWLAVCHGGHGFAYVKASEGVDAPDPRFADHWKALAELGLPRGAYHFYVTEDDPDAQAELFLSTLGDDPGDLLPVVDVELIGHGTRPGLADRLRRYLDRVETALGVRPMIYTSPDFWEAHLGPGFQEHPLWVAEYGVSEPRVPASWEGWHLWQYAGNRKVPGVEKEVDVNRVHPERGLAALRIGG